MEATGTRVRVPASHARRTPAVREGPIDLPAALVRMKTYAIFGDSLGSELDFPLLRRVHVAAPRWILRRDVPMPLPADAELLGTEQVQHATMVRLYYSKQGLHLDFDDTGRFDVEANGREITWRAPAHACRDTARVDITGRVMATALHCGGDICFHASAVGLGEAAVGFLGAKGAGKTTLAWALVRAGAKLITDDTLRVQPGRPSRAYPGVHELRLRDDAARRLPPDAQAATRAGDRLNVHRLGVNHLQVEALPLRALYVLAPISPEPGDGCRVHRLDDAYAAIALVRHAKIAPLLSGRETLALIDRVVALVRGTPVYLLEVPRDFAKLDQVIAQVRSHHVLSREPAA
jgi:hypothetical protein